MGQGEQRTMVESPLSKRAGVFGPGDTMTRVFYRRYVVERKGVLDGSLLILELQQPGEIE